VIERGPFLVAVTGHPDAFASAQRQVADLVNDTAGLGDEARPPGGDPAAPVGAPLVDASTVNPDNLTRN
jgi:hypothetical protein